VGKSLAKHMDVEFCLAAGKGSLVLVKMQFGNYRLSVHVAKILNHAQRILGSGWISSIMNTCIIFILTRSPLNCLGKWLVGIVLNKLLASQ